jgi:hypothetical protein
MIAHVISISVTHKNDLGTRPSSAVEEDTSNAHNLKIAGSATLAAYKLLIAALALAKCSTIMFVQCLLLRSLQQLYLARYGLLVVFAPWAIGSMIALGLNCESSSFIAKNMSTVCGHQHTRWAIISALDILTELLLILMAFVVIWPLRLSPNLKGQIITAFAFRARYVPSYQISLSNVH